MQESMNCFRKNCKLLNAACIIIDNWCHFIKYVYAVNILNGKNYDMAGFKICVGIRTQDK